MSFYDALISTENDCHFMTLGEGEHRLQRAQGPRSDRSGGWVSFYDASILDKKRPSFYDTAGRHALAAGRQTGFVRGRHFMTLRFSRENHCHFMTLKDKNFLVALQLTGAV